MSTAIRAERQSDMATLQRILHWNIRWGGEGRIPRIVECLLPYEADVLVLTEHKHAGCGVELERALRDAGWRYQASSGPITRQLGVLVASRQPILRSAPLVTEGLLPWHMLHVTIGELTILGVYLPWDDRKIPYWEAIVDFAVAHRDLPTLLIGDFNTGATSADGDGIPMRQAHYMTRLGSLGFVDPWRRDNPDSVEYSWMGQHGIGKRLDHALFSPGLDPARAQARYSHVERDQGVSDHSILIATIA